MKTLIALLALSAFSLQVIAAETTKKKSTAKPTAAAEAEKPSAKVEAIAKTLTSSQKSKLLDLLNEGSEKELQGVPGVGETRAAAIKKARPFADVTSVVKVEGIGEGTFAEMVAFAKAGFAQAEKKETSEKAEKKAPAKAKSTTKKKETK